MDWQLIALADIAPSRWRNGGGVTRELIAWPDSQAWRWRISVADVASDGPFSRFDGVRRWLAILSGAGVRLKFADRVVELRPGDAALAFAGDAPVDAELLDGPVQDVNLMLRADGGAAAAMRRVDGALRLPTGAARTVAILARSTAVVVGADWRRCSIPPHTLGWCALPAGCAIDVDGNDAICMEIGD